MTIGDIYIIGKSVFQWTIIGWRHMRIANESDRRIYKRLTDFCNREKFR